MQKSSDEQRWEEGIFRKRPEIVSRVIAGETMLVPIKGKLADMQRIFSLTPVASYIWERLDGESSLEEVLRGIIERFSVDRAEAERDLREFVEELAGAELIEKVK